MTLGQALALADDLKPNVIPREAKIRWLSVLDGLVRHNVHDTHVGQREAFGGYGPQTPEDTQLLIPAPYDTLYRRWLEAQIDLTNGEFERYNADITVFADEYRVFENQFHRTHTPLSHGRFRF